MNPRHQAVACADGDRCDAVLETAAKQQGIALLLVGSGRQRVCVRCELELAAGVVFGITQLQHEGELAIHRLFHRRGVVLMPVVVIVILAVILGELDLGEAWLQVETKTFTVGNEDVFFDPQPEPQEIEIRVVQPANRGGSHLIFASGRPVSDDGLSGGIVALRMFDDSLAFGRREQCLQIVPMVVHDGGWMEESALVGEVEMWRAVKG